MPTTLTSNTRCHSSSGLSATVPIEPMPALFTRMSTPPRRPAAVSTASRTDASSVTSAATLVNSSPGLRSSTATFAPRLARSRAVASPIPDPPPVTIAASPLSSAMSYLPLVYRPSRPPGPPAGSGGRDEALPRPAQAVDLQSHLVTRAQVGVVGQTERDPGRGAGVDQVARLEHHVLAQVPDEVRDPEDHGPPRPILPLAPVHREPQPEHLGVGHFVGGDQPRPQRVERLARFAEVPLRRQVELEGPFRHVVADRVARDAGQRLFGRAEVTGGGADDDAQFDFPVGPLRAARYPHVVIGPDYGGRVLHEHHRTLRYRGARLGGVVGVIEPDAHDLSWPGDGRADPAVDGRQRRPCGRVREGRGQLGQPAAGEELGSDVPSDVPDQAGQVTGHPVVIENGRAFLSAVTDSQQLHDVSAVDSAPTMRARNSANRITAPSMASIQ